MDHNSEMTTITATRNQASAQLQDAKHALDWAMVHGTPDDIDRARRFYDEAKFDITSIGQTRYA